MKPTIKIYIGAPVSRGEANALKRLYFILSEQGVDALLLVNFTANNRQIDCVVITAKQATLVDFKEITGPVRGGLNGPWFIRAHGGGETRYPGENPYAEVSTAKYALSDEMAAFQKRHADIPAPRKRDFYRQFDAAVCICPEIMPSSTLPEGDFKCWIWGFPTAIEKILTRKIDSSWNMKHWQRFACDHLNLEGVSLDGATDPNFRKAEQELSAYRAKLTSLLSYALPPRLPDLPSALPQTEHSLLLGPAGIGKTVRLQHHALEAAAGNTLVLFLEAMHYTGDFRRLLQKSVAPAFSRRVEELLDSASRCAAGIILIVDGFDRCKARQRSSLMHDIVAFHEGYNCRLVISSQFDPNLPPSIKSKLIQMPRLTPEQKLAVFRFHSGDQEFLDYSLLDPFETAHDLMVAAKCRSKLGSRAMRTELYDAYVAQCLPEAHATVAGALCRHLAAVLSREFASVMSRHDFEKAAERFVSQAGATLRVVDEVAHSGLVKLSLTDFSFSHELIQEHLYADWLCRTAENFRALISEVQKPAHRHLGPAVLSRQSSAEDIRASLRAMPDADLFSKVFQGRCGTLARQILVQDCHALLSDAAADLPNVVVDLKVHAENGKMIMFSWETELKNCREWAVYEATLAIFIGRSIDTLEFAERVAELLAVSGASLRAAAEGAAETAPISAQRAFDNVLHCCLEFSGASMELPARWIFKAWLRSLFQSRGRPNANGPWAQALWLLLDQNASAGAQAFGLYALCKLYQWAETPSAENLVRVFRLAWNSRLRSEALEMLTDAARRDALGLIRGSQSIRNLLQEAHASSANHDIFMNTFLVDAMNEYGMIPPPVDLDTALAEMRGVLNPQSDYARAIMEDGPPDKTYYCDDPLADAAYRILGLFFEDVYQGVYRETFSTLAKEEQIAFMNLAASAKDPSFHLGYILHWLVEACSPVSQSAFQRYAARILLDSPTWQDSVRGFLLAIVGCAKLKADLPLWQMEQSVATEAWRILREIIYERLKHPSARQAVDELWLSLQAEALFGAADALFTIERSRYVDFPGLVDSSFNLIQLYPDPIRSVMEWSLLNLEKLVSVLKPEQTLPDHKKERAIFVLRVLGRVGDRDTVEILKRFAGDPTLGQSAIAAIKAIKARTDLDFVSARSGRAPS